MGEISSVKILVYVTEEGRSPYLDWIGSVRDAKARAKMRVRIERLRVGLFGDCKSLGGGLYEIRVPWGRGFRVYFCFEKRSVVVLLGGGDKGSQRRDIVKARGYLIDYKEQGASDGAHERL